MESRTFYVRACALWVLPLTLFLSSTARAEAEKRELPASKGFYILIKPKNFDVQKTYDLIVALHGMGDTAQNYAGIFWRMLAGREALLAVPEGGDKVGPGFSWNTGDLDKVVELLDDVKKYFSATPSWPPKSKVCSPILMRR